MQETYMGYRISTTGCGCARGDEIYDTSLHFLDGTYFIDRYSYYTADRVVVNADLLAAYVEM